MKTFLKNIQRTGLAFIAGLLMANALLAQNLNVPLNGDDITAAIDTYVVGTDYHYTITPQEPIDEFIEWGISNISDLDDAGLQMAFGCPTPSYSEPDCSVFDVTTPATDRTFTPDGNIERLHFIPDPSATPDINGLGHEIELSLSDGSNTVNLTLTIPVQRRPVSVVFVLDRSGSMGSPPHGGSGEISRMDILQTAASLFINKLDEFGVPGDSAALVYFESTVEAVDTPPPFDATLTEIEGNAGAFTDNIIMQTPGSATAMGDGLLAGKNKFFPGDTNKQFIFLFTDGEQNAGNLVNNAGTQAGTESLNNADNSIQIVTIGTGAAAGMAPANLLQAIADENTPAGDTARHFLLQEDVDPDGTGSDFNSATGITNFFNTVFEVMLSGGSPQTVAVEEGTMPARGSSAIADFEINANIDKILFELITPDQEPFFTIEKDGTSVNDENASVRYISGPNNGTNSLLAVVNLEDQPASGITSEGTWTVNMRSGTGGGQPYQIKAQVDDHRLDYTFEVGADDFKVEDVLRLNADIAYDNNPLEDANISAIVLKPGEDLGDLLARADVKFDPDTTGDNGSVGYQKLLALIEDKPALIDSLNLQKNTVNLAHTADGNYEAQFSDTDVSGVYQVIARISGASDSTGNYERLVRRTVYLRFGDPDPEISTQEYSQTGASTVQLLYTPMYAVDGKNRFVGPGFANGIKVTGTDVGNVTTTDNGDGSYTINLEVLNGNTDPDIKINLSGVDVYEGKASSFGSSGGIIDDFKDWLEKTFGISLWLFLLILLLILVIIWVIRKNKN